MEDGVFMSLCVSIVVCVNIALTGDKRMNLMEKRWIATTISCSLDKMLSQNEKKKQKTKTPKLEK